MLPTPTKFKIAAAAGEGEHKLTAFDCALCEAGIGNVNLLRVSSILPPACRQDQELMLPPGSIVPSAYGSISSDEPGALISAAVGIGFSEDKFGVIMEYAGRCSREEAAHKVQSMIREAFILRGMKLNDIQVEAVEHRVRKVGAVVAAVVLWY